MAYSQRLELREGGTPPHVAPLELREPEPPREDGHEQAVHDIPVDVLPAEEVVAGVVDHVDDTLAHLDDRSVEGAAPEVVDEPEDLVGLLLEAVAERGGDGLLEQWADGEAGELAGFAGGLGLRGVEGGGDGDHRCVDLLVRRGAHVRRQRLEDLGGELFGQHGAPAAREGAPALLAEPHVALELHGAVLGVRLLPLPGLPAHVETTALVDPDRRRGERAPTDVRDHPRLHPVEHRHRAVRRPQVDPVVDGRALERRYPFPIGPAHG